MPPKTQEDRTQLEQNAKRQAVEQALNELGRPGPIDIPFTHLEARLGIEEDWSVADVDGEKKPVATLRVVVLGADGKPRTRPSLLTGEEEPFKVTDLIREILGSPSPADREAARAIRWTDRPV